MEIEASHRVMKLRTDQSLREEGEVESERKRKRRGLREEGMKRRCIKLFLPSEGGLMRKR